MTNTLASITFEDDITIITLDDGNVNAFSYDMLTQVHRLLDEVPQKSGALIIKGRNGIFSGGFDLKTIASGDLSKITKMIASGYSLILKLYSFDRPIIAAPAGPFFRAPQPAPATPPTKKYPRGHFQTRQSALSSVQ